MPRRSLALLIAVALVFLITLGAYAAPGLGIAESLYLPELFGLPTPTSPDATPAASPTSGESPTASPTSTETPTGTPSGEPATATATATTTETPSGEPATATATATVTPAPLSFAEQVVALVNAERAKVANCPALAVDSRLTAAAEGHNLDMATNRFFDHTGSDGSTVGQRTNSAGYPSPLVGENIAAGYASPSVMMAGLMNSIGHRNNILNCNYRDIGVGYLNQPGSEHIHYWTQVFGVP